GAEHGAEQRQDAGVDGAYGFVYDTRAYGTRTGELLRHELKAEVQLVAVSAAHALDHRADHVTEHLGWWRILLEHLEHSLVLRHADRFAKYFGVEAELIAEVVIDCGHVCAG